MAATRDIVIYSVACPLACLLGSDVILAAFIGTSERRQIAAFYVVLMSIPCFTAIAALNFLLGRSSSRSRRELFLRGLALPVLAVVLECLYIFHA